MQNTKPACRSNQGISALRRLRHTERSTRNDEKIPFIFNTLVCFFFASLDHTSMQHTQPDPDFFQYLHWCTFRFLGPHEHAATQPDPQQEIRPERETEPTRETGTPDKRLNPNKGSNPNQRWNQHHPSNHDS